MDNTTVIRIVAGFLALGVLVIVLLYLSFLAGVLRKCSPWSRTMQPGMVWLMLIPFFNVIWSFIVVLAIADSLGNEFRLRNIPVDDPKPGKSIGIAMAVCQACGIIPLVNILAGLAGLVLWIMYWVKIAEYSRQLDLYPIPIAAPPYPQQS
jgi:hypothetical protein